MLYNSESTHSCVLCNGLLGKPFAASVFTKKNPVNRAANKASFSI